MPLVLVADLALVSDRVLCGDLLQQLCSWVPVASLTAFRRACGAFHGAVAALLTESDQTRKALNEHMDSLLSGNGEKRVWVGVRVKPYQGGGPCVWQARNGICVAERTASGATSRGGITPFFFDRVFGNSATQQDVWNSLDNSVMRCFLRREHCCVLAYGQTGSGKTHTMFGPSSEPDGEGVAFRVVHSLGALLRRAAQDAQHALSTDGSVTGSPSVEFSFLE